MLDLKQLRENPQTFIDCLSRRGTYDLQPILDLDRRQRELELKRSQLQAQSNTIGKQVGERIRAGTDPQAPELQNLRQEASQIKATLSQLEPEERTLKAEIDSLLLVLPNLPSESTPLGKSEVDNVEVRRWGDELIPNNPNILPHWEIGEKLGILDTERSVKVAQSRFVTLLGAGAALERSLIQFMLDQQIQAGYTEVIPPFLVNTQSLTATGQLPKFAEESFQCQQDDLWLSPTSEVPLVNLYRNEILAATELPIYHCAYTPCFRREAGSYGRDTRGLIRLHQFNKVELIKLVHPETSESEHKALVQNAEAILQALKLPYRVMELCTGDLGFAAAKCYDLEVWLPSSKKYRKFLVVQIVMSFKPGEEEFASKTANQKGTRFVHTLNGSGLAVGRTMAAILENYQQPDGTVRLPDVLQPYLGRENL